MKRIITLKQLTCIILLLFKFSNINAQSWEALGPDDANLFRGIRVSLAIDASEIYVIYNEIDTDGYITRNLIVKKFNGSNWESLGVVGQTSYTSSQIAINGGNLYAVYGDYLNSNKATVKKYNGNSWETIGTAGISNGAVDFCKIAFEGTTPYILYVDLNNANKAFVQKFNGTNWEVVGGGSVSFAGANFPSFAVQGTTPYVVYGDASNGYKAVVKKFNNNTWETVGGASISTGVVNYCDIAFDDNTPYITYQDMTANEKITVQKFNGSTWQLVGTAGFSAGSATDINIEINNGIPYVVYKDGANNSWATLQKFNGATWQNVTEAGFSKSAVNGTVLAFDGATPYVAFYGINSYVSVIKHNGITWELLGAGFSALATQQNHLVFNNGYLYTAYMDYANDYKATVKMYNGTSWNLVGPAGFSTERAYGTRLAFNGSTPYIVYSDSGNESQIKVKQFDGTSWIDVGQGNISDGLYASQPDIKFIGSVPYVVYQDYPSGGKAVVKKLEGNIWVNVGAGTVSAGLASNIRMAVNNSEPYIVYGDNSNGNKATVRKFNGNNWVDVGSAGFSAGEAGYTDIAFNGSVPYVVYRDANKGNRITVQKFNGSSWELVGTQGFSSAPSAYTSITFVNSMPYVAYHNDQFNGGYGKVIVQKFNGTDWEALGSNPIFSGDASFTAITTNNSNKLFITYNIVGNTAFAKQITIPNPLPITLTSFTGTVKTYGNQFNWQTATETNNKGFEIERKGNDGDFVKIGFVTAGASPNQQQSYSFTDGSPLNGDNYYRLKQIDNDGKFTYIQTIIHLKNVFVQNSLGVYPNPAKNSLTISGLNNKKKLKIADNLGKTVLTIYPNSKSTIDVDITKLPIGIYSLSSGTQFVKFIKAE